MSRNAISVDALGKSYEIGANAGKIVSFREGFGRALKSPFRRLRDKSQSRTRTFWALKDVTFDVKPGEVIGIIGRNGAGKSTLLKILSRITEPTEGSARVRGHMASLLEVGTGFHPELTGRENVYLNGSILGMRKAEIDRKFDEIVAFAEVEQFLDTQVKYYSSGMYVRLAFAVAAHLDPQILVVDEVLAVGDTAFQKKCVGRMEEVNKQGRTVLFVSHNVPAVQNLCNRCIYLESGKVKMDGDSATVLEAYARATTVRLQSEENLEHAPGRVPGLAPCMKRVRVTGRGSVPNVISMGDDIEVEIQFETPTPMNDVTFWVYVKNGMGIPIFGVDTDQNPPEPIQGVIQQGRVVCRIDRLPLMPGTYSLDLFLGSHNMNIDTIHDACRIEVNPADVFGTGKLPLSNSGSIFWPARWEITSDELSEATR